VSNYATGIQQGNGNIAYIASFPVFEKKYPLGFSVKVETVIGADYGNGLRFTNTNTLILGPDCFTVVTSHPGLPSGVNASDPRIGRIGATWQQAGPIWW
jgi:hypothetical protein